MKKYARVILSLSLLATALGAGAQENSPESGQSWLSRFDYSLGATGVFQGSSGYERDRARASMSLDFKLSMDLERFGTLNLHLESGEGEGMDGVLPSLSGINDDADDVNRVRATELWHEFFIGDLWRFRYGKVDLTTDFDTNAAANDETTQFLSCGFVNNLGVEFPDDNSPGAMLWYSPDERWDIGFGIADAQAEWENVLGSLFVIGEICCKPTILGRPGNYRVYGWHNDKKHETFDGGTEGNYGFGLSMDQKVSDATTLFARYGWQDAESSEIRHAVSAGLEVSGSLFHRDEDVIGFAWGMVFPDSNPPREHHLELYYNIRINQWASLTPDIQWVHNPAGDRELDDYFVFGARLQVTF